MGLLIALFLALFGTAVGSSINAVVYRLRHHLPYFWARSICPNCKETLSPLELIPILSYILLKGKCKNCRQRISVRYPAVEVATGILFAANYIYFFGLLGFNWDLASFVSFLARLVFIVVLMIIFVYDLMYMEIPDEVVIPGIVIALVADMAQISASFWEFRSVTAALPVGSMLLAKADFVRGHFWDLSSPYLFGLLAGVVLAVLFYVIVLLSKERAMGGGDIKLAILLGFVLPWPFLVPALYVGFVIGAAVGLLVMAIGRGKMKTLIPLAPFLVTGAWAAMYFGADIMRMFEVFKLY
jgi:prepilin signal peptidase PulO-like enzyme (type II secretory pathway)